jgi:predicted transcriptional regulator
MAGAMINPLMAERLVDVDRDTRIATITDKGREALSNYALEAIKSFAEDQSTKD